MKFKEMLNVVGSLSPQGPKFKPHKFIALLAVLDMINAQIITNGTVTYDENFKDYFTKFFQQYSRHGDRNRPYNPFFHLKSSGFWELIPKHIEKDDLRKISSIGGPNDLNKLISYAKIDPELFSALLNSQNRLLLENKIKSILDGNYNTGDVSFISINESVSLYAHESIAINKILISIKSRGLGYVCSNIDIHDPQSNRYYEIDMFIASPYGLYVIELKHWTGKIVVQPYSWQVNGFSRPDPHKSNNFKAKLIKGLCERQFPYLNTPFTESVVTLTHPDADTDGCSSPHTQKNQPTFDSIETLVDYLKHQQKAKASSISPDEAKEIRDYIQTLHSPGRAKEIQFPGYEIVEQLYQAEDRAELIARPTSLGNRSLMRLRIFFHAGNDPGDIKDQTRIEKARGTLNAIAGIKDHPNILKVLTLPSQEGHLIEASDWSVQGTLRDMIARDAPFGKDQSIAIMNGILSGLSVIHQKGVVHRNLCPENILMAEDIPKLMNFDLSYQLTDNRVTVIPDPEALKRSAYIAPEIYSGGMDLSENADLFSAGVLFYQMLTGELPFQCSLDLIKTHGAPSKSCLKKLEKGNIPKEIISLIEELLQLDACLRPESAADVLARLEPLSKVQKTGMNTRLQPGDRHDQFKILEFIKQGAEAQLYKAKSPIGPVLLKLFNIDVLQKRIINEQQMSTAVSHGSIVRAEYGQFWEDRRYLLAFRWVEGCPITLNENQNPPSPEHFHAVASALLDALDKLHGHRENGSPMPILHNDIKPENILLTQDLRPMLIDFGIAGNPSTGLYSGTAGYVAPDSVSGEDRQYSIQGDLFGLGVTLFEWFFGQHPYGQLTLDAVPKEMQSLRPETDPGLESWFTKAISLDEQNRFGSAEQMLKELHQVFTTDEEAKENRADSLATGKDAQIGTQGFQEPEEVDVSTMPEFGPNPFVAYLNTLHNRDAANSNALAESQACNRWFGLIHVEHPLTKMIYQELCNRRRHVILTGHAGDGKSTIGLELYKRVKNIPVHEKLTRQLCVKEDLDIQSGSISIVKDFSEWDEDAKTELFKKAGGKESFAMLLISNTGTLLSAFKQYDQTMDRNALKMENDLLKAFSSNTPTEIVHNGVCYLVINLAMFDNLEIARKIFERMIHKDRWHACETCPERRKCTICRNVTILQDNPLATDRIFYLYRRMFEYKDRFTLRQIIAHMAYMITAGMEYSDIQEYANAPTPPLMTEFFFFNRFFGDNGRQADRPAGQMQVIRTLAARELGRHPCPSWERRLWLRQGQDDFELCARGDFEDFSLLRRIGAGIQDCVAYADDRGRRFARQQVRRILFFLHDFTPGEQDGVSYLSNFLNSPMLLPFLRWQNNHGDFSLKEQQTLKSQVLHVLQEQFAGVRLPEQASERKQLYITLNRNDREMRQGTQVVLADFPTKEFRIVWEENQDSGSLIFSGTGTFQHVKLPLTLPFLDYVRIRQQGETGQSLQTSFSDRLECFKAQLISLQNGRYQGNEMILLRLQADYRFKEHRIIVEKDKLEVMNA
ncbi:protein kinase [uncultured Desulfobacter sp.]|uniref:protein kinase domain-containing protein n=1 Tax=uncultured Desulfobacter sp. TaxID=240139 RepID=UPI002AAC08AE|nr:protein kinase [uncultured Desulfobacter sp.]